MCLNILAIDMTFSYASIALLKNKNIHTISSFNIRKKDINVYNCINSLLASKGIQVHDLDYISFSKGPGNFTGLRMSCNIAQGLSLGLKIPILCVSTFILMAEEVFKKKNFNKVIVAMQATKEKFYWGKYKRNKNGFWFGEKTESLLDKEDILKKIKMINSEYISVGSAWSKIPNKNRCIKNIKEITYPNIRYIFPSSLLHIQKNLTFSADKIEPVYLGRYTF
ncbi:tRNA (adenosine(37)-N6)-threonylcarbamoyltransferase complex dimerization subunit type 1 TsaB [Buchnera aphidicola]|uniref:tRNA threonylcarbamoyladenosine biosynthesis protein TsaB n=1 Tax=Buchnera aphidicola (Anoecia oenotherae) TaxID=1241833 RepID=A0A4D6XZE5_9GAMM|nr:tRNA (adenosine(37)-N6)-threonylcarbamoyltransferase complex dimerization subunit type 1 TsaB [Buchnera aphidicola]QCI19380.1 tRNA (adenosine(37)-N6)-threonylcarbamoyltransferase complex dimerization subunit type 1 TsaB [Buchnera aphidicola (Anoecia oenotherae)]